MRNIVLTRIDDRLIHGQVADRLDQKVSDQQNFDCR